MTGKNLSEITCNYTYGKHIATVRSIESFLKCIYSNVCVCVWGGGGGSIIYVYPCVFELHIGIIFKKKKGTSENY